MVKYKKSVGDVIFDIVNYTIMLALLFVCVYPFWYVFIYSISDPVKATHGITFLPVDVTLQNYKEVLALKDIFPALGVSIARTVIGTVIHVVVSMFLGYLFTKPMYGRKFFYRMLVITMYVSGGVIPTYLVYMWYGLTNTFWVYVIPGAVGAYNIILCKTFVENLPESLEESARLDGAGYMTIFAKIVMPLSKAIIATITVFSCVGQWNAWTDNHIYNVDERLNTLQYILWKYLTESQRLAEIIKETGDMSMMEDFQFTPMAVRMTITMLVMIPILCVYPYMQKHFVKGVMVGAIKG